MTRMSDSHESGDPLASLSSSASLASSWSPAVECAKASGILLGSSEVRTLMIASLGMVNSTVSSGMSLVATESSQLFISSKVPEPWKGPLIPLPALRSRRSCIRMSG
jgi:hypothetical protein